VSNLEDWPSTYAMRMSTGLGCASRSAVRDNRLGAKPRGAGADLSPRLLAEVVRAMTYVNEPGLTQPEVCVFIHFKSHEAKKLT
jgi:hypothetical protein